MMQRKRRVHAVSQKPSFNVINQRRKRHPNNFLHEFWTVIAHDDVAYIPLVIPLNDVNGFCDFFLLSPFLFFCFFVY